MRVGLFHPAINLCGGAELVAINILDCVKKAGHSTVLLTNEKLNQERLQRFFGRRANVDSQIVFPFELFKTTDFHNIYTDFVRASILKSKCDILVDTYSDSLLPYCNFLYIHYPLSGRSQVSQGKKNTIAHLKETYYLPYYLHERAKIKQKEPIVFANSVYTMKAVKKFMGKESVVLYPPVASYFFVEQNCCQRTDTVVSIGRISPEKRFTLIPKIAKLTNKHVNFIIVGISGSANEMERIKEQIVANGVSDRVKIVANVPREQLRHILRSSKVFLHTAVGEHFGISIAEAMASGCITICHDSGGPKEFVPRQFRFHEVETAAELINRAINEWSLEMSNEFSERAERFKEVSFAKKFTETFCTYLDNE